jgi:hypothetical protein
MITKQLLIKLTKEYSKSLIGRRVFNNTNRAIAKQLSKKLGGYSQSEINQIMDGERIKGALLACKHERNTTR